MRVVRAVLDTNVLVAAIRSRSGASFRLLSLLERPHPPYQPVVSVPLVAEYQDALHQHRRHATLSAQDVEDLIDFLCRVSVRQEIFFLWRPFLRDPKDELVLEAAVAAGASTIVSFNVRDFAGADQLGVRVVTPQEFLEEIGELP
jgi:putative PIN family toxin of toxin-antitoxin system